VSAWDPINDTTSADIPFIIRPAYPGTITKILYHFVVATYQAYNPWPVEDTWQGQSLYGKDYQGNDQLKVSFDRPFGYTIPSLIDRWDMPFVAWLEDMGFRVDFCTSVDLHADPHLLDNYQLLLSVGHDEYWSKEMRDQVEAFIANGGNVAFFSGNVCWWQVRFEDNNRRLVCYRDNHQGGSGDPTVDDPQGGTQLATVRWRESPVDRPENTMTGVSFYNGAMGEFSRDDRPAFGYRVRFAEHWLFDRTGLQNDDTFGKDRKIIGNETDAALLVERDGRPWVTALDRTPLNFVVLAEADLPRGWKLPADVRTDDYPPRATMGLYRNHGTVFTAATTDWPQGLVGPWTAVHEITLNVLRRLGSACGSSPLLANSGFEKWSAPGQPEGWTRQGTGVTRPSAPAMHGRYAVTLDATGDSAISLIQACRTWLTGREYYFTCGNHYEVGCWVKAASLGAVVLLEYLYFDPMRKIGVWKDLVAIQHPGDNSWRYLCAVGHLDAGKAAVVPPLFRARVRLTVAAGAAAVFDDVSVKEL